MSIRFKLANWISGGDYAFEKRYSVSMGKHLSNAIADRDMHYKTGKDVSIALAACVVALERIEACETKSANATVRRMARIAREALEGGQ